MSSEPTPASFTNGFFKRHAELVGGLCGLPCLLYWIAVPVLGLVVWNQRAAVMMGLVFCGAVAGFLITGKISWRDVPVHLVKPVAGRTAVRTSFVSVLLGGGMLTLASALARQGLGVFSFVVISPGSVILVVIFSIFPAIFMGILAAKFAASFKIEPAIIGRSLAHQQQVTEWEDLSWRPLPWILVISFIGYLSPAFLPPKTPTVGLVNMIQENPISEEPRPKEALLSSVNEGKSTFHYEKPQGLAEADVGRWRIATKWSIPAVENRGPVVISPDGKILAVCSTLLETNQIRLVDLFRQEQLQAIRVSGWVTQMTWNPTGNRLLYITGDRCGIIELGQESQVWLPQPKDDDLPEGLPWWWAETEVVFMHGPNSVVLDLESLQLRTADRSVLRAEMDEDEWQRWLGRKRDRLASKAKFELQFVSPVRSYAVPNFLSGRRDWSLEEGTSVLAVNDQSIAASQRLHEIPFDRRSRYLSSDDGSIIVRVADNQAICHYVKLDDGPAKRLLEVDVGKSRDSSSESMVVRSALDRRAISVFITSPVVNPLNGKTVAPDREMVKARARLVSWEGRRAGFWIEDFYGPIQRGDVIGDPHFWDGKSLASVDHPFADDWFAVLEELTYSDQEFVLERSILEGLSKKEDVKSVQENPRKAIEAFVKRHHQNATLRRLDDFVSDYAATGVDYFTNGIVDRDFIRKGHEAYQDKWRRITEVVKSPIDISRLRNNRYQVHYRMDFRQTKVDGSWASGTSVIALILRSTPSGLKIVDQKAKVHNARQGQVQP